MGRIEASSLYGTVELLILRTLQLGGPQHGLAIAQSVGRISGDRLVLEEGALYPALHRMQERGLLESEWRISEKNRRAKFYVLTAKGERALARELASWLRHTTAVLRVLDVTLEERP
jgi:PadR family transcriptional regulator PadR